MLSVHRKLSVISITMFLFFTFLNYHRNRLLLYFLVNYRISIISLLFWASIPNPAYPTYSPPTRKVAHPWLYASTQSPNIQNSKECIPSVRDGEKVTARSSSCIYPCQNMAVIKNTLKSQIIIYCNLPEKRRPTCRSQNVRQ